MNSTLYNALKEDEKQKFHVQQTLKNQKMQETSGKMQAVLAADKTSREIGLKGLKKKVLQKNMQDVSLSINTFDNTLKQNIEAKTKLKTQKLSAEETKALAVGIKKVSSFDNKKFENNLNSLSAEEVIKIGREKEDRKTAELILEKSGRKEAKKEKLKEKQKAQKLLIKKQKQKALD